MNRVSDAESILALSRHSTTCLAAVVARLLAAPPGYDVSQEGLRLARMIGLVLGDREYFDHDAEGVATLIGDVEIAA